MSESNNTEDTMPNQNIRAVANSAIKNTYKGILRVGNNIDLQNNTPDKLLDSTYYVTDSSYQWAADGINSIYSFISPDGSKARYIFRDEYSQLKLPVTDSMGHFLNFSLGETSTEIGKFPETGRIREAVTQFDANDNITFATIDTTDYITIGLSTRVLESFKTINGGSLLIDSHNSDTPATLIINNYWHHTLDNDNNDTLGEIVIPNGSITNYKLRTIIKDKKQYNKYDAFIYDQENYNYNNYNVKDCYISIENIRDYVNKRLQNYINANNRELPSGTIISQYCNLDKWYCIKTDGENTTVNDFDCWQGYRPAMYQSSDAPYSYWNNIQGKAFRGDNYLYFDGDTTDQLTGETVPDFKRGYVLCNGDGYTISLVPSYIQSAEVAHRSLDLFFNLFYVLGYYYHNDIRYVNDVQVSFPPAVRKAVDTGNGIYEFSGLSADTELDDDNIAFSAHVSLQDGPKDYNVLYSIDMATITAFKVMNTLIANDALNEYNTKEKILNWLSEQKIPDEYIFNVIDPTITNIQTNERIFEDVIEYISNGQSIKVDIGKEINRFDNLIPYYVWDGNNFVKKPTRICDMAEVRFMAELFAKRHREDYWKHFNFTFYVPKMFTSTDEEVNVGESYRLYGFETSPLPQKTVGLFPGSNALTLSTSINLSHKNMTIDLRNECNTYVGNYNFNPSLEPHAHAVAKGSTSFNYPYYPTADSGFSQINSFKTSNISRVGNILNENISDRYIAAANYHSSTSSGVSELNNDKELNYIFQEQPQYQEYKVSTGAGHKLVVIEGAKLTTVYNSYSGQHGQEYQRNGFNWFGASSSPLWYKNTAITTSNYTKQNTSDQGYFRPESIKVLPLIKL